MHAGNDSVKISLFTTTLWVKENTFWCKMRPFALLSLVDGESHMFVYLEGRPEIYIGIFKLIPRRHNSSWPLFMAFNKTRFKRCSFPLSVALIGSPELLRPRALAWFPPSNMITSLSVLLPPLPLAIEFVFLNNHLIQIPIIFCEAV